ncbi:hypothetical protein [Streptomyces abyssomicinicus]|uniref:hypothetical protein n=1 Tax=Streptomyces abyssomicinicus TaxID=574929 RepID=UPI00124FC71D|nr:hypothetical protein [Streptomyces abyssomicinicus]
MSSSHDDAARDDRDDRDGTPSSSASPAAPSAGAAGPGPRVPKAALVFDDPLDQQSSDDTDRGWGDGPRGGDAAADLRRFLDEKPPHHL